MDQTRGLESGFLRTRENAKTMRQDECALISRCKEGDLSAFDDLVRRYEKQVYNFAYRLTQNYDDANDIATDAFIKIYNSIESFRGDANFSTWLFRIVTNLFLDWRKRSKAHMNIPLDEYIDLEESTVTRQIEDPSPSPLELLEASERFGVLERAINDLPEYQRIMVFLYHTQGQSYEEIAQVIGLPIGTVKSRLNRARLALRKKLEPVSELFDL